MQVSHTPAAISISFDDPTLVSSAGLSTLAQDRVTVPGDKGANAGAKITALIAGMLAGADSINDMDQLTPRRHAPTV